MKKLITIFLILISISFEINSQTIVASYPFGDYSQYNSFWGITHIGDTLRIATDFNGSIYKVTKTGNILDSMTTPFNFNHGLAWDGSGFWIAEDFESAGARLYKINSAGVRVDSIQLPSLIGGPTGGVGDIEFDGTGLWFSVYYPDFTVYPFAYAYKINLASRLITDTIPLRGKQVQGITIKGDTILYVSDGSMGDPERIYSYRKATGDTLFSFPVPDPDGVCRPRGLHWDGEFLWLIADRIGNNMFLYKTLYKYSLTGSGNPQITSNTNNLDFGNTIIGTNSDRTLTITNIGTAKLIISNYNFSHSRFSIIPNNTPDTLDPSQSKNYTVRFSPDVFDTVSAQLRISSNDAVTPVKIISLRGKGVHNGSWISTSVSNINYGTRRVNSLSGGYFIITNKGTVPLSISNIFTAEARFKLDTVGLIYPVVIDTQKTKLFRIWFNPSSATSFSDTAHINSNAVNEGDLRISLLGTGQNNPTALGDIYWQGNIPDNPNTTSDNFKIVSMKEIPDVNSDGVNDVVVSTDNYWTICYNGNSSVSADTLWRFNTRPSTNVSSHLIFEDGMQIMEDVNGDGIRDVVIGTGGGNELVWAFSGRTGKLLWTYGDSSIISQGDINSLSVTKDYNSDGKKDVLVAASGKGTGNGRHALICLNAVNGNVIFYSAQSTEFNHAVTSTSVGGAIDFSNNGGPYGITGFNNTGGFTWTIASPAVIWNLKELQDINTDGVTDIASFVGNGTIRALSGNNGGEIWTQNLGSSGIDGNIRFMDDLSGDGFKDIVSSGPRNLLRIDSRSSSILWSTFLDNNYIHGVDQLSDLTGNGIKEIVAGTQNSNLYVVNGDSGRILFTYNFGTAVTNTVEQVSALKSIDGNSSSEFLGGSRTGKLICFSGGPNGIVGIQNSSDLIPEKFSLSQNYPNPFNPVTRIKFDIPINVKGQTLASRSGSNVKLIVYDALGKEVTTLVNEKLSAGSYEVEFSGNNLSSGIYFYHIVIHSDKFQTENYTEVKRMILLK